MSKDGSDPFASLEGADLEAAERIMGFAKQLGRAISLSVVAATCGPRIEDEAIARADEAWTDLAVDVIKFAMEEDR